MTLINWEHCAIVSPLARARRFSGRQYDTGMRFAQKDHVQGGVEQATAENGADDVFFKCENCGTALVVAATAAGMTLKCQRCGAPTTVPHLFSAIPKTCAVPDPELQRRLTENESQRTEVKGYINQLGIQLHRWHLRLEDLDKRKQELLAAIAATSEAADLR